MTTSACVWSPNRLNRVLLSDNFRVGLIPATVLQCMSLHCKLDDYRTRPLCGVKSSQCKHTAAEAKDITVHPMRSLSLLSYVTVK
jgi:hypothetical protein